MCAKHLRCANCHFDVHSMQLRWCVHSALCPCMVKGEKERERGEWKINVCQLITILDIKVLKSRVCIALSCNLFAFTTHTDVTHSN